jgi:hypothetical protein
VYGFLHHGSHGFRAYRVSARTGVRYCGTGKGGLGLRSPLLETYLFRIVGREQKFSVDAASSSQLSPKRHFGEAEVRARRVGQVIGPSSPASSWSKSRDFRLSRQGQPCKSRRKPSYITIRRPR